MITQGDYIILKFVFDVIIKNKLLITSYKNNYEIKNAIKEQIKLNEEIKAKIEEKDIKCIEDNIFNIYLMIDKLKKK